MKINRARLIQQLKIDEGVVPRVYKCPAGYDTVGVGRNLESIGLSQQEIKYLGMQTFEEIYDKELSDADMEFLLSNDIDRVVDEIRNSFDWFERLDGVRKEIVVNMVFNLGLTRFRGFKNMIAALKAGDYMQASREMMDSRWYRQVGDRAVRLTLAMQEGKF